MNNQVSTMLAAERSAVIEAVFEKVRRPCAPRYREEELHRLHGRVERLVDELIASIDGDADRFIDYIRKITYERVHEGYHLNEFQHALSVLEREAWELCATRIETRRDLLAGLGSITWIIGQAKDQLAQIYLTEKHHAEALLERLGANRRPTGTS
jgi:hypothetical protein